MARSPGLQIDASVPYLTDRVHCRGDHARERFETVEFAESERGQCRLNGLAQGLIIDRARETARESSRKLLESENVQPVLALTRGSQAPPAHVMATVSNYSVTAQVPPAAETSLNGYGTAALTAADAPDNMTVFMPRLGRSYQFEFADVAIRCIIWRT